jgi:hypothetical protein
VLGGVSESFDLTLAVTPAFAGMTEEE